MASADRQMIGDATLGMTFARSLTTAPLERSSTGGCEASFCKPASGGLPIFQYSIRGLPPVFLTHATGCPYCSGASRDLGHRPVLRGTGRGNKRGVHHRAGLEQQPWAVSSSFRPRWASKLSDPENHARRGVTARHRSPCTTPTVRGRARRLIKSTCLFCLCVYSMSVQAVPFRRMFGGGFRRCCIVKIHENQRLGAHPALQVQNIE